MMADTLTPELIEQANALLTYLSDSSNPNWKQVMAETLDDNEYEANLKKAQAALDNWGTEQAVGAIAGGTGVAKDGAGLSGEQGQQAIQVLKAEHRIQQCGRGRGKCIIILNSTPLAEQAEQEQPAAQVVQVAVPAEAATPPQEAAEEGLIPADNIPSLTRAIRDSFRSLTKEVNELRRDNRAMQTRIDDMQRELDAKDQEIEALNVKLEGQLATTWQ